MIKDERNEDGLFLVVAEVELWKKVPGMRWKGDFEKMNHEEAARNGCIAWTTIYNGMNDPTSCITFQGLLQHCTIESGLFTPTL